METQHLLDLKLKERADLINSAITNNIFLLDNALGDAYMVALNKLNIEITELENKLYGNL